MPSDAVRPLTAIDLFCGAGGLTAGFKAAGYRVVYAIDKDRDSCDTYALNHPEVTLDRGPIAAWDPLDIAKRAGSVDVIVGGPACQGFSTAGRRHGEWVREDDERNNLWSYMMALVNVIQPRAFLLENVPGLVYWREGEFGQKVLTGFRRAGYVVDFEILMAANYGVPQLRRRLFMVGVKGEKKFRFPHPTHLGGFRRDTLDHWERERVKRGLRRHISTWEAIGDLPLLSGGRGAEATIYPAGKQLSSYAERMRAAATILRDHQVSQLAQEYCELIKWVPQNGTWRDIPSYLLPDRFYGMRRTDSSNLLGRLGPDRPAYTITTEFDNVTVGCYVHPWEDRALSVREGARLQSFPDTYRFSGSLTSRYRQVGNAVPPLLATALAHKIEAHLAGDVEGESATVVLIEPSTVPPPTDERTGRRMRAQRRADTRPEVVVRQELHRRGMRFRVNTKPVAGLDREADILFPAKRVAVFVDGCFWHGCPDHSRPTKSHSVWWADKIAKNKERDAETTARLKSLGWAVVRVWEHQRPAEAASSVEEAVRGRTTSTAGPTSVDSPAVPVAKAAASSE